MLARLERHFADVQDVEFTIEDGKLWILQSRAAKRTPRAALRFVVDFVREGLVPPDEAIRRLEGLDRAALAIDRFAEALFVLLIFAPDPAHSTNQTAGIPTRISHDITGGCWFRICRKIAERIAMSERTIGKGAVPQYGLRPHFPRRGVC